MEDGVAKLAKELGLPLDVAAMVAETPRGRERERLVWRARVERQLEAVRASMTEYLGQLAPWQSFTTLTFAPTKRLNRYTGEEECIPQNNNRFCQRVFHRFVGDLNRSLFGRRAVKQGASVQIFVPWETQKWGALHCHPLIAGMPDGWRYKDIHRAWKEAQRNCGLRPGRAHVLPYEDGNVRGYVAKYVTKDLTGDLWSLVGFPDSEAGSRQPLLRFR